MTFTEAAVEVLRREGKPLHFKKIAEIAIRESLLDHVGKIPEEVMGGQLADHCRLPHLERRVVAVQPGTFALVEWGIDEDPHGLENLIEPPPEGEPPYRPQERHPIPSREIARSTGRGAGAEQRARRSEEGEERRGKRYPPPADVAFEILAGSDRPLTFAEIAARGAERLLMPDAFVRDASALAAALTEDNKRREGAGKKALFGLDGELVTLVAQPEPGERAAAPARVAAPAAVPGDARRAGLAALRRRLRECDAPTVEHVAVQLLEKLGFRDAKVAKRGREHVVYTARRKMGLADVRHGVRVLRAGGEVTRRDVTELRRDLSNYGAQIGMVVSAGDAAREARGDAAAPGQLPVLLLCGDALAEAMAEAALGCRLVLVPEVDDAFFKGAAETAAQEETARKARRDEREARGERQERPERGERADRREGERQERGDRRERPERGERRERPERGEGEAAKPAAGPVEVELEPGASPAAGEKPAVVVDSEIADELLERRGEEPGAAEIAAAEADADEGEDEGEEGDEAEPSEQGKEASEAGAEKPAAEGEPRRRRRRRRRRGGRGRGERREQAASAGGAPAAPGEPSAPAGGDAAGTGEPGSGGPAGTPSQMSTPLPPPLPAAEPAHEPPQGGGEEPR